MIVPIAKSKASDVLDTLEQFIANGSEPDAFTLARIKRDANSSINSDPANAYTALGFAAAFEWDEAQVHQCFQRALKVKASAIIHANYGMALQALDCNILAVEQICLASTLEPTNLSFLKAAIDTTISTGQFKQARTLLATLALRDREPHSECVMINDICQVLEARDIGQDHTEKCNAIAYAFLRERKIRTASFEFSADLDDRIVFFKILIDLPFDQVYELDDQLGRRLADEMPDFSPSAYWLGLECANNTVTEYEH